MLLSRATLDILYIVICELQQGLNVLLHNQQNSQCCFYSLNKYQVFQPEQQLFPLSALPVGQDRKNVHMQTPSGL